MPHADQWYIEGIKDNDPVVIKNIYDNFFSKICSMVLANGGNETDAADIFQDALLNIFRRCKMGGFLLECPMEAYLYIICKNRWRTIRSSAYGSKVTFTDTVSYTVRENLFEEAEYAGLHTGRLELLQKKLQELDDYCRKLLELSWQGVPLQQTAEMMNTTYSYIRKKKSGCTDKLIESVRQSPGFALLKW